MLYESHLAGAFNYLWGYRDASLNKSYSPQLLANQQNPLDNIIADMIGNVDGRYFLIEFKRDAAGIYNEVHGSRKKAARAMLFEALKSNHECREISSQGHFACWQNDSCKLEIAQYICAADDGTYGTSKPSNLCFHFKLLSFLAFYDGICEISQDKHQHLPDFMYWNGQGVTGQGMIKYLELMLACNDSGSPYEESLSIFGFSSASGTILLQTSFNGLLDCFFRMKNLASAAQPTRLPRP